MIAPTSDAWMVILAAAWMVTLSNDGLIASAGNGIDGNFIGRQQQYYGDVGLVFVVFL